MSHNKDFFCVDIHFHGLDGIFFWEKDAFVLILGVTDIFEGGEAFLSVDRHIFVMTRFFGYNKALGGVKKACFCVDTHFYGLDGIFVGSKVFLC